MRLFQKDISTTGILQNVDPKAWREHRFGLPEARWERLKGRDFWVTGAGTGYGRCIALALAAAGARVFISGRRIEKLRETVDEGVALGIDVRQCIAIPVDIRSEEDLARAARNIQLVTPCLYGLVNSAALPQPGGTVFPLISQSMTAWTDLLTTNVTGSWLPCKAAMPLLSSGEGFRILFLSSFAGWASTPGFGPYNISKSAVNTLGVSLAAECGVRYPEKDVQINVLVPGEARTEMNQGSTESPYAVVSMVLVLLSHPPGGPNGFFFNRDGRHLAFAYTSEYPHPLLAMR
ncbi:MAG: SDR family oxidoreductase [Nitrospira sp.]|nr:SDR family oxidoreductase [Nitrospira sp.]